MIQYEQLEHESEEARRLLREEELILEVTSALSEAMEKRGLSKVELADRLGCSKSYITRVLGGSANLTLRSVAGIVDALSYRPQFKLCSDEAPKWKPHILQQDADFSQARQWVLSEKKVLSNAKIGEAV